MPQIRKDPLVNRWVIIATERSRRPASFNDPIPVETAKSECPYCTGRENNVIAQHDGVRVISSGSPLMDFSQPFVKKHQGLYEVCPSFGSHEVVLETPEHTANMADLSTAAIANVFKTYAKRMELHRANPAIKYVLAYKNYGVAAGSRPIGHSRSQIMAMPVNPRRVKDKLDGAKRYYDFHDRCLMCDMIHQEVADGKRIITMNNDFIALVPFAARFPFEVMIIPKTHHHDYAQGIIGREASLAAIMQDILKRFKLGLNDPAYNFMIQTSPFNHLTTVVDDYHWHIEIMPRLTRVAGFERGTGFYISPIPPEMAAQFLKEVII